MATNINFLSQIQTLVKSLSVRQRLLIVGTAVLAGVAILAFSHWRREGDFRPVYTSLSPEDAGAIVQKLKESGTPYRISEGGSTIMVPSAKVGESRLAIAAAGLPKTGRIGFELFDKTHFGATDFMERVNLRRALEGELERSLTGLAEVENSRVHITFPKDSVFAENRLPAKASVMVKLKPGIGLSNQNVTAIQYLVASAVEGLAPNDVSVLDMKGNLLGRPKEKPSPDSPEPDSATIDYQQKIEKALIAKINNTLEPLLGADRFRASVVAECDFTSGEVSEETFDPSKSVMTSEQRTKETSTVFSSAGVPGTPSNLPRAVPRPGTNNGVSKETENVNYQTTRMVKRMRLPQGSIKRLSASVLLDQALRWEGIGANARRILVPPTPEQIKQVNAVVAAAIGIQPQRGDNLVVETMPFESTLNQEPPAAPAVPQPAFWQNLLSERIVVLIAALLLVVFIGCIAAYRLIPGRKSSVDAAELPLALAAPEDSSVASVPPASETTIRQELENKLDEELQKREQAAMLQLKAAGEASQKLTEEIIELARKDAPLCANIVRTWLTEGSNT